MMKPLEAGQLAELQKEFPVDEAPVKLTRAEKLGRLATLLRDLPPKYLALGHLIEVHTDAALAVMQAFGALDLATMDETFLKDGLKSSDLVAPGSKIFSVKDVRDYLELTTPELHEFSCNCGGPIDSRDMAKRVQGLADRGPPQPGIVSRIANAIIGS